MTFFGLDRINETVIELVGNSVADGRIGVRRKVLKKLIGKNLDAAYHS
ncbi:hypothetical protein [Novipirellula caenicola]|uniref:Uncharacterized protein n=1 Tax=Novipirellula caenicola TaxID=1536901 RepID=A0ABP9VWM1_9BACT